MIKAVIYDADGVVITPPKMFSEYLAEMQGIPATAINPFFENEFTDCLRGNADLKVVIKPYLRKWKWGKTVDELLALWFSFEDVANAPLLESIEALRTKGITCVLATNQERYRYGYMRKRMQIQQYFDRMYISCDLGYLKPEVDFFDVIWQDFRKQGITDKAEVMYWDDRQVYVDAVASYGFPSHRYFSFEIYQRIIKESL